MTTRTLKIIVDQAGNAASGLGNIASKLTPIKAAAGLAAGGLGLLGGAVLGAGAGLVSLGSDAEEMQGMFDVVFSETGGRVARELDNFGNAVGRNKFELMEFAAQFGDTLKPMGFTETAAADLSVQMTQLAVDLGSFKNMAPEEAFQRLQATLIGNHENALAFGVIINENTLKTELAAMGADTLTGAQLEQAKVQARINLLMKGTTDAQGDAERTAGSWANQTRALKAELSEAATAMGVELLPVVTPFLKDAASLAKEIMPEAVAIFKQFTADLQANVGPAILLINDAVTRVAQAFGVNTEEVTTGDAILKVFKLTLDAVVIALQVTAITAQGVAGGVERVREAMDIAKGIANNFGVIARHAMNSARDGVNSAISAFNRMAAAIRNAVNSIPDWLIPGSPTPFEVGLRGIASAGDQVDRVLPRAFAVGSGGSRTGGGSGGGDGIQIVIQYQPTISTADKIEIDQKLIPLILGGLRRAGVAVGG
jgi:hypothetical protein